MQVKWLALPHFFLTKSKLCKTFGHPMSNTQTFLIFIFLLTETVCLTWISGLSDLWHRRVSGQISASLSILCNGSSSLQPRSWRCTPPQTPQSSRFPVERSKTSKFNAGLSKVPTGGRQWNQTNESGGIKNVDPIQSVTYQDVQSVLWTVLKLSDGGKNGENEAGEDQEEAGRQKKQFCLNVKRMVSSSPGLKWDHVTCEECLRCRRENRHLHSWTCRLIQSSERTCSEDVLDMFAHNCAGNPRSCDCTAGTNITDKTTNLFLCRSSFHMLVFRPLKRF